MLSYSSVNSVGRKTNSNIKSEDQLHPSRALQVKLLEIPRSQGSPQVWWTRNLSEQSWCVLLNRIPNLLIFSTKNISLVEGTDICIKLSLVMRNADASFLIDPHTWTPFPSINKLYTSFQSLQTLDYGTLIGFGVFRVSSVI